jgi:hypothetical protein
MDSKLELKKLSRMDGWMDGIEAGVRRQTRRYFIDWIPARRPE